MARVGSSRTVGFHEPHQYALGRIALFLSLLEAMERKRFPMCMRASDVELAVGAYYYFSELIPPLSGFFRIGVIVPPPTLPFPPACTEFVVLPAAISPPPCPAVFLSPSAVS